MKKLTKKNSICNSIEAYCSSCSCSPACSCNCTPITEFGANYDPVYWVQTPANAMRHGINVLGSY